MVATIFAAAQFFGGSSEPVADFYIATDGNDGNPGSAGSPWLTFAPMITAAQALPDSGEMSVHVRTGTYNNLTINIGTNVNTGCSIYVSVAEGTVFDGPAGVDASFINVAGSTAYTFEIEALGTGATVQGYDTGTGNAFGMDSSGGATLIARNFLVQDCVDGWSLHGTNSNSQIYDMLIRNCSKSCVANVNTGGTYSATDCRFEAKAGGAVLGMISETTNNSTNATYTRCEFIPAGTALTERNIDGWNARFVDCTLGTTTACVNFVGSSGTMRIEDSYINAFWDQNRPVNMLRCFGKATMRMRNSAVTSTIDHCVFVDCATGQTDAFLFRNFDPTSMANAQLLNSVFRGYVTAIGSGYGAADATYWANSGSVLTSCCTFGNTTNVDADIIAADPGSITGQVTTDPQMPGTFNTTVQADYVVGPTGPCIGTGTGGSNIGFAASDI